MPSSGSDNAYKDISVRHTEDAIRQARESDDGPALAFPIVALGASAGGLSALIQFFKAMPPGTGIGFVVLTHLGTDQISLLPELLARNTKLPVTPAFDGEGVQPNHVYVLPPGAVLSIAHGVLNVRPEGTHASNRTPIDHFLRALAKDQRERSICVILTGAGHDGSLGLKAIKAEGGLVIVQDPATAEHTGMPESAVATGLADYVLRIEHIPGAIADYVHHFALAEASDLDIESRESGELNVVLDLLHAMDGEDFRPYKKAML